MDKLTHLQALLLKWLRHFNVRTLEQIRITSIGLCVSNDVEDKNSIYKLLYPLLKMGFVEFIGKGKYQVSPSLIIFYPNESIAVGINLTDNQKEKLQNLSTQEDIFGNVRFSHKDDEIKSLCLNLSCKYLRFEISSPLVHFPKIKDVISKFDQYNTYVYERVQFYDTFNRKWEYREQSTGIFRSSPESSVFFIKNADITYKIPSNSNNPEGWLLAECFQASYDRKDIFFYDNNEKILTVNNLNLPILIERTLRLCSLYKEEAVFYKHFNQISYPNISPHTTRQINRIFDTQTINTNG